MTNMKLILLASFLALFCTPTIGIAGDPVTLPFLRYNLDARSSGMGYTQLSDRYSRPTPDAGFASVFAAGGSRLTAAYDLTIFEWLPTDRPLGHALRVSSRSEKHALGLGVRCLAGMSVRGSNEMGQTYSIEPVDAAIDLGYAYRFMPSLSASLGINYIYSYSGRTTRAVSFSAGLFHQGDCRLGMLVGRYTLGASLSSLGSKVKHPSGGPSYALPTYASIDPSLTLSLSKLESLGLALSLGKTLTDGKRSLAFGGGVEYRISDVALRAGYSSSNGRSYLTLGGGLTIRHLQMDLSMAVGGSDSPCLFRAGLAYIL